MALRSWRYIWSMKRLAAIVIGLSLLVATGSSTASTVSSIKHIQAGDISVGYREIGNGPPLVLIMGYAGTMAAWDPALLSKLATKFHVIIFDNRGVATTSSGSKTMTVESMADDTAHLIAALGFKSANILGWSMGGFIGQELALRHPDAIRKLVLAATSPGSEHAVGPSRRGLDAFRGPDLSPLTLVNILFPESQAAAKAAFVKRVLAHQGLDGNSFTISRTTLMAQTLAVGKSWAGSGQGTYSRLPKLKQPTLVSGATDDDVVPAENSRLIATRIPGAELVIYHKTGHAFLFQLHERFGNKVIAFLDGNASRP